MTARLVSLFLMLLPTLATATLADCRWELMRLSLREPQEVELTLHHGNFDAYGHLNSTVYPDLVNTALRRVLKLTIESLELETVKVEMNFKRPVTEGAVVVKLQLSNPTGDDGWVFFEIRSKDGSVVHADGKYRLSKEKAFQSFTPDNLPNDPASGGKIALGTPIEYKYSFPVLFNDFEPTRRMDFSRYLDYVNSSRWYFLQEKLGINPHELLERGVAFFLVRAEITPHAPIKRMAAVTYRSWVSNVLKGGTELEVPFAVQDESGATVYASGKLYFAVVDISGPKPKKQALPEWVIPYFVSR